MSNGLYGIQTWSAGAIFPAVIAVVEEYETAPQHLGHLYIEWFYTLPLATRLLSRKYVLMLNGEEASFGTYDEAHQCAVDNLYRDSHDR